MHAVVLASLIAVAGAPPSQSVLIMPLANKSGVTADLTEQLTTVLTHEASNLPGFRVVSVAEVQGAMTQEQLKQVAACDALSCAAEIGGALNTEQVVIGSLGMLGDEFLLTLTRLESRSAKRLSSIVERIRRDPATEVLDRLAEVTPRLFGLPEVKRPRSTFPPPQPPAAEATLEEEDEAPSGGPAVLPWALRGVGVVGLAATLPPLIASGLLTAVVIGFLIQDGGPALPGQAKEHQLTFMQAVLADFSGFGAVVFGLLALGGLAVSASLLALSMVAP